MLGMLRFSFALWKRTAQISSRIYSAMFYSHASNICIIVWNPWRPILGHYLKRDVNLIYFLVDYVWVLNSEEQFDRAMHVGVDGIMTDYPVKLAEYMRQNGHLADRIHENNENYQTFDGDEDKWSINFDGFMMRAPQY